VARLLITDLYGVLGVAESAPADEVSAAYRRAARDAHPDSGGSHEKFLLVDLARRVLTDPSERAFYDRVLSVARLLASARVQAVADGAVAAEVFDELARAASELEPLAGVAVTIELREMLAAVTSGLAELLEALPRRREQAGASTGRARSQRRDPREEPDVDWQAMADEMRWKSAQQGFAMLRDWVALREQLMDPHLSFAVGRLLLHQAFVIYGMLRRAEDTLLDRRRRRLARDEKHELEVEYGVLFLAVDCAAVISDVGMRVGRRYSTKPPAYFDQRLDEVVGLLRARGWDELLNKMGDHRRSPRPPRPPRPPITPCRCGAAPLIGAHTCWEHSDPAVRRAAQEQAGAGRCAAQSRTGRPCPGTTYRMPLCPNHARRAASAPRDGEPRRPSPRGPAATSTPGSPRPETPPHRTRRHRARQATVMVAVIAVLAAGWLFIRWFVDDSPSAAQRAAAERQLAGCVAATQLVFAPPRAEPNDPAEARIHALRIVALVCTDLDREVLDGPLADHAHSTAESAVRAASCMTGRTFPGLACAPQLLDYAAAAMQLQEAAGREAAQQLDG
jgi:curved DNA-binding protein CbpA